MSNILRSIFVSLLPAVALFFTVLTIWDMIHDGWSWTMIGRLIAAGGVTSLFASIFVLPRARTGKHLMGYTTVIAIGTVINIVGTLWIDQLPWTYIIISGVMLITWLMYVTWYSTFDQRDKETIKTGQTLQNFKLINRKGKPIWSSDLYDKPTIWMFYRGNWCPLCMAQIKEIAADYKEIEERGAQVALVSPQPHHFTKGLAKRHDVNFHFLTDPDATAAQELGIYAANGTPTAMLALGYDSDTVLPTVLITDKGGKIVYADLTDNYRVRPEPAEFLKVLDKMVA